MDLRHTTFERILLIKPSSLGDIIHALPVLNGLRWRYPAAHISWLVNTEYAAWLGGQAQLDEVIPFNRQAFRSVSGAVRATFKLGGFAQRLRAGRFDLALDLQGLFRSGLMAYACGAAVRLGFRPAREGSGMFYNARIESGVEVRHAVDKNYLVSGVLGFEACPPAYNLAVCESSRRAVGVALQAQCLSRDGCYVVVVPGSRWETKNWWPERFSAVIEEVQRNYDLRVVLSGSAGELPLCERIAAGCGGVAPVVLAGLLDLAGVVALLDGAAVVVCNDTAPLHIATALNKPVVTVFGPTDPVRSGPHGRAESVLQADLSCVPCYFRRLRECPHDHRCMAEITVEQVLGAIGRAIHSG